MYPYDKKLFIREKMTGFNMSYTQQKRFIENVMLCWDSSFDFLPGKEIVPYLMKQGLEEEKAYEISESIRKERKLKESHVQLLAAKNIPLTFVDRYYNTLPDSEVGSTFIDFMIQKVQEVKM